MRRLTLALLLTASACGYEPFKDPPIHLQQNMDFQKYFEAQEPNPFYQDGRAMRPEVEGTVAMGSLRVDDHLYTGKVGEEWAAELPERGPEGEAVVVDAEFLARGQERYNIYCAVCHSKSGVENGLAVQRGMLAPPKYTEERLLKENVGYFYHVITNGVRNMQPYAAQIPVKDRWAIAAYVRVLQRRAHASLALVPDDVKQKNGWSN